MIDLRFAHGVYSAFSTVQNVTVERWVVHRVPFEYDGIDNSSGVKFIAVNQLSRPIGWFTVRDLTDEEYGGRWLWGLDLFVRDEQRGLKVATSLLQCGRELAKESDISMAVWCADQVAKFWEANGFRRTGWLREGFPVWIERDWEKK